MLAQRSYDKGRQPMGCDVLGPDLHDARGRGQRYRKNRPEVQIVGEYDMSVGDRPLEEHGIRSSAIADG